MNNCSWILIDTETDGFRDPIHVLEIAGQRMNGWNPVGEKFRVLLNHKVDIPADAVAIHGYTAEFLDEYGVNPLEAHEQFRSFVGDDPLIAHNLSFDWNRALFHEWLRLGLKPIGKRGFCTLMLSRRLIECESYSLDAIRVSFNLNTQNSHRAFGDVDTLVSLFGSVLKPRLEASGLTTYESIAEFSRQTPVGKCLGQIKKNLKGSVKKEENLELNKWYYLDSRSIAHGPFTASEVTAKMGATPFWIWKEGLDDWIASNAYEEFKRQSQAEVAATTATSVNAFQGQATAELLGICRGIVADGKVTNSEVAYLARWLEKAGHIDSWPGTEILEMVERIVADDYISKEEKAELFALLTKVTS
jgi:DNA polymerase-3 subunit epsilon